MRKVGVVMDRGSSTGKNEWERDSFPCDQLAMVFKSMETVARDPFGTGVYFCFMKSIYSTMNDHLFLIIHVRSYNPVLVKGSLDNYAVISVLKV